MASSSVVEREAVNFLVAGSSPASPVQTLEIQMPDPVGRPDVCCMNTSAACQQHGPCSHLAMQFADDWTAHVPSARNTSKVMHQSLRLSGAEIERRIIIDWLHDAKKSPFADMLRRGEHYEWYEQNQKRISERKQRKTT